MIVRCFWPECPLSPRRDWSAFKVDCYLVEFEEQDPWPLANQPRPEVRPSLLVSKDLSRMVVVDWFYPYSQMWNGTSPFRPVSAEFDADDLPTGIRIQSLGDLGRMVEALVL